MLTKELACKLPQNAATVVLGQQAIEAIFKEWPEAETSVAIDGWRLFEEKSGDYIPSDLPILEWSRDRFDRGN